MKNNVAKLLEERDALNQEFEKIEKLFCKINDKIQDIILTPFIKATIQKYYESFLLADDIADYLLPRIGNRCEFKIDSDNFIVHTYSEKDGLLLTPFFAITIPIRLYDCDEKTIDEYFREYYKSISVKNASKTFVCDDDEIPF